MHSKSSHDDTSFDETNQLARIPGVSKCLNQGILPKQHRTIKEVISIIAARQSTFDSQQLTKINSNLIR